MHKPRILIVDDEPGFIRLLKIVLEKTGRYLVQEESDATKAVGIAKQFRPNLILLDFVMPKIDGGTVASCIRSVPQLRDTPILFLSASVVKINGGLAQIAGFPAIAKPIGIGELVEAIDANLVVPPSTAFAVVESFLATISRRLSGRKGDRRALTIWACLPTQLKSLRRPPRNLPLPTTSSLSPPVLRRQHCSFWWSRCWPLPASVRPVCSSLSVIYRP